MTTAATPIEKLCGANRKHGGTCRNPKGFRTSHPGKGKCRYHGGDSPNGRKHARKDGVETALAKLGVPHGTGDPFELLRDVVRGAHGQLLALLQMAREAAADVAAKRPPSYPLVETIELLDRVIRTGGLVAKETVDSDIAERAMQFTEAQGAEIQRIVFIGLDVFAETSDRAKAEEAVIRELVAVTPAGDERN